MSMASAPEAARYVHEPVDFSVLYDAVAGTELGEMELEARKVGDISRGDILNDMFSYREEGLLNEDYLPTSEGRHMKRDMDQHLDILGDRRRAGEVYTLMDGKWADEALLAVKEGDYQDLIDTRSPENREELEQAVQQFMGYGIVTEHITQDGSRYGLTDQGLSFVDSL